MLSNFFAEYEADFLRGRAEIERLLSKPSLSLSAKLRSTDLALRQLENELKPRYQSEPSNPQVRKVIGYRKSFNELARKAKEKLESLKNQKHYDSNSQGDHRPSSSKFSINPIEAALQEEEEKCQVSWSEGDHEQSSLLSRPETKPTRSVQEATNFLSTIENLMLQSKGMLNSVGKLLVKDKEVIDKAILTTGRVDSTLRLSDNLIAQIDRAAFRKKICLICLIVLLGFMIILIIYRKISRLLSFVF